MHTPVDHSFTIFTSTLTNQISSFPVWPTLFLLNVSTALNGTHYYLLIVVTAAGVVPCGIPKKRPRTSPIVQFIFYVWSFEISRNILRNQETLSL